VMADRLHSGAPMAQALHGVFVVGLVVCTIAVVSAFLVPAGRARDLAAARIPGTPTRAGG
jgi:hypothetical protein